MNTPFWGQDTPPLSEPVAEHRKQARLPAGLQAWIRVADGPGEGAVPAVVVDLSRGGAAVSTESPLAPQAAVELSILVPGKTVTLRGTVLEAVPAHSLSVARLHFARLTRAERAGLDMLLRELDAAFVRNQERLALRPERPQHPKPPHAMDASY